MLKKRYELKENFTGKECPDFKTVVDVTLTDTEIVFEFDCKNSQCYSASDVYNADLWKGDVCEAFICTDGTRKFYYEIEVAPNNAVFLKYMEYITPGNLIENDIQENFVKSEVKIDGNDYKLKFALPLDKIGYTKEKGILYNIFRIETEGGIQDKNLLAMNPTLCDTFHENNFLVELKED